jgi:hypothetical protein
MSGQEEAIVDLTQDQSSPPYTPDGGTSNSDIEEIVMEDARVDEDGRRRNIENRRARLARAGINEAGMRARSVIVISDSDSDNDGSRNGNDNGMDIEQDLFGPERRMRRRRQLERDMGHELRQAVNGMCHAASS